MPVPGSGCGVTAQGSSVGQAWLGSRCCRLQLPSKSQPADSDRGLAWAVWHLRSSHLQTGHPCGRTALQLCAGAQRLCHFLAGRVLPACPADAQAGLSRLRGGGGGRAGHLQHAHRPAVQAGDQVQDDREDDDGCHGHRRRQQGQDAPQALLDARRLCAHPGARTISVCHLTPESDFSSPAAARSCLCRPALPSVQSRVSVSASVRVS